MTTIENPNQLFEMAEQILNEVVQQFAEVGLDLPERRYVHIGGVADTAHDCEQVTVSIEQHYAGTPEEEALAGATCDSQRTAAFVVEVVRCIPNMKAKGGRGGSAARPPTSEEMNTYSQVRAQDMLILLDTGAIISDKFYEWSGFVNGSGGLFDVAPGVPTGNMQGVTLNLTTIVPTW